MNKRYMDFVPAGKTRKPVRTAGTSTRSSVVSSGKTKKLVRTARTSTRSSVVPSVKTKSSVRTVGVSPRSSVVPSRKTKKSVKAIGTSTRNSANTVKSAAQDKRLVVKTSSTFVPPKANFINQEKVVKRPLSKNTYRKRVEDKLNETPGEEPQGPITIISKPEKDATMGIVITVIITIILGAAAGTVAFLLLPK